MELVLNILCVLGVIFCCGFIGLCGYLVYKGGQTFMTLALMMFGIMPEDSDLKKDKKDKNKK